MAQFRGSALLRLCAALAALLGAHAQLDMDAYQLGAAWGGYGGNGRHFCRTGFVPGSDSAVSAVWDYRGEGRPFSCAVAADDSFYCGSNGNLYAFSAFDGDSADLKWNVDVGSSVDDFGIQGVPLIVELDEYQNGTVYVGDRNEDSLGNDNSAMRAYRMSDGELLWTYPPTFDEDSTYFGEILTSAVIGNDGRLYFGTQEGSGTIGGADALWAVDALDGSLLWSFPLQAGITAPPAFVNGSDAATGEGTIYLNVGGLVYSLGDGGDNVTINWSRLLWESDGTATDSPVTISEDGRCAFVGAGSSMVALDTRDGSTLWEYATGDLISSPAAISETGDVIFGSVDNSAYRVSTSGRLIWEYPTDGQIRYAPVILGDDSVLISSFDGYIHRVDEEGVLMYKYQAETSENTFISNPAVTASGHILYGASDNYMRAIGGSGGCAKGKYTNLEVSIDSPEVCISCAAGAVTTQVGLSECTTCEYGSWAGVAGSTFCYTCTEDTWCPGGAECSFGRDGVACSSCAPGYFTLTDRCEQCPENSWLLFGAVILLVLVILFLLFRASGASAYTTGTKFSHELSPNDQIMIRVSVGSRSRDETFDVKSVHHDYMVTLLRPLPDGAKVTKARFKYKKRRKRGKGKWRIGTGLISAEGDKVKGRVTSGTQILATALVIGVTYIQMTAMFIKFDLNWPPVVKDVIDYVGSIFNFNIPDLMASPECDFDAGYFTKWGLGVLMPLFLLGIFFLWFMFAAVRYQNPVSRRRAQDRCIQVALITVTILYVYATAQTVEPLDCTTQPDGTTTLDANPGTECTLDNNEYFLIITGSIMLFILYGVGLPAWLFRTLSTAKKQNRFGDVTFVQRYGWLFLRFNKSTYWWEIVIMIRKLTIVIVGAFNSSSPQAQANWTIAVLAIALVAHIKAKPFVCYDCLKQRKKRCRHWSANDKLEGGVLFGSILVLTFGVEAFKGGDGDALGVVMLVILGLICCLLFKTLWDAYKHQKKERKRLQGEGLMDTTDQDVRKIQMVMAF